MLIQSDNTRRHC